jgi:hypothetical protein
MYNMKNLSPLKAIRKYCLSCEDGSAGVKDCAIKDCPLYPFRFGTNPARKGIGRKEGNIALKQVSEIG